MADDPRQWHPLGQLYVPPPPPVDPLRALLADEDRAVDVIGVAIAHWDGGWTSEEWQSFKQNNPAWLRSRPAYEMAQAVLAALREVAGL